LSEYNFYLILVLIKKKWVVSNEATTQNPIMGPTIVPGRDRASCRLTDVRRVPNLITCYQFGVSSLWTWKFSTWSNFQVGNYLSSYHFYLFGTCNFYKHNFGTCNFYEYNFGTCNFYKHNFGTCNFYKHNFGTCNFSYNIFWYL